MSKEKDRKGTENYLDKIILRRLRYIIILCAAACIFCEFAMDILDVCKLSAYGKFFGFYRQHKDFFTNVALGCLGSAVISYLMLRIQIKTRERDKRETLNIYLKKAVSKYWDLIFAICRSYDIQRETEDLRTSMEEFISYYGESGLSDKYLENYVELFKDRLIPLVKEAEAFICSFHLMVNEKEIVRLFSQEVYNRAAEEIYKDFYNLLSEKFQLQKVNKELANIEYTNSSLIEELDKTIEMFQNLSDKSEHSLSGLKYSERMMEFVCSKNLKKIKAEISEKGISER